MYCRPGMVLTHLEVAEMSNNLECESRRKDPVGLVAEIARAAEMGNDLEACARVSLLDREFLEQRKKEIRSQAPNRRESRGRKVDEKSDRKDNPALRWSIYRRDGYVCRYCGERVVDEEVMRMLGILYPQELPYDYHWKNDACHPFTPNYVASWEHVKAVALGGTNNPDNLVCTCAAHNYALGDSPENRKRDLFDGKPAERWDGLCSLLIPLARRASKKTNSEKPVDTLLKRRRYADWEEIVPERIVGVKPEKPSGNTYYSRHLIRDVQGSDSSLELTLLPVRRDKKSKTWRPGQRSFIHRVDKSMLPWCMPLIYPFIRVDESLPGGWK